MKLGRRSRWIIAVTVLAVLSLLFLSQVDAVQATFNNMHAFTVLLRVETEIMQKTPAGQYYESLFWKHNDELMQISSSYPENEEEFWRVTRLFIPGLEALLNGEGDAVQITSEQVESLKEELDWLAFVGSPTLREDIQREQQRLPLETLVGMTMNEVLDFINSGWNPESVVAKTLVPESDGEWAYYVHDGVYLEYPSQYTIQISGSEKDYAYFMPSTGMPEYWHSVVMKVKVWAVPSNENTDVHTWYSQENILWETPIQTAEFQGFEFIQKYAGSPTMDMHAFLYNQQEQLAVDIWVFVFEPPPQDGATDYRQLVNQRYEYFQHMVDSLRIWKP